MTEIKLLDDWLDNAQLVCTKTDGITKYNVINFTSPSKFASTTYNKNLTLEARDNQEQFKILINKINNDYNWRNQTKIKEKDDTLKSARKLIFIREDIIRAFKRSIFLYIDGFEVGKESDKESDDESHENEDTTDMPDLENEEPSTEGQGLTILTPNQMLNRLPISLAQLNAGNNSEKLKNGIRKLLYSLYISKKLTKQLYKGLTGIKNGKNLYERWKQ